MMDKFKVTKRLDEIALCSNPPAMRPKTYTIREALKHVDDDALANNIVLKRNSSQCKEHVILPPLRMPITRNISLHEDKGHLGVHGVWFAQEYVQPLKTMGEMRLFIKELKDIECALSTRFISESSQDMEVDHISKIPALQNEPK